EAHLLRVHVEGVLGQTRVLRDVIPPAAGDSLGNLQEVEVHHYTLLPHLISQSEPAAGQPGAIPEVAPPRGGDLYGLRARQVRQGEQGEAEDNRAGAPGAMSACS